MKKPKSQRRDGGGKRRAENFLDMTRKRLLHPRDGGCEFLKSEIVVNGLEIFEIKKPSETFLLGMINGNYFQAKHNSYVSFQLPNKGSKVTYYKIVYPLCK